MQFWRPRLIALPTVMWDSIAGKWDAWSLSSLSSAIVTGWCSVWGEFTAFIWTHYIVALGRLQAELCMFQRNCKSCLLCLQGVLVLFRSALYDCYDMIMNFSPDLLNCWVCSRKNWKRIGMLKPWVQKFPIFFPNYFRCSRFVYTT